MRSRGTELTVAAHCRVRGADGVLVDATATDTATLTATASATASARVGGAGTITIETG